MTFNVLKLYKYKKYKFKIEVIIKIMLFFKTSLWLEGSI